MTFLTTLPPDLKTSPRPLTARKPRKWSRAAPALMRRGPDRLQASTPPRASAASRCRAQQARANPAARRRASAAFSRQRRLDLVERRRRPGGQHQLARLVAADAGKFGQIERARRLQRPAEPALDAAGDQLERLLGGERVADGIAQFRQVAGENRVMPHDAIA